MLFWNYFRLEKNIYNIYLKKLIFVFFPTCQVRVVRF